MVKARRKVTAVFFLVIPSMLLLQWVSFRDLKSSMDSSDDDEGGSMHMHGESKAVGGEDGSRREADEKELDAMMEAIRPHHPMNRMQCGSWVEDYARLHREVLTAGPGQGKYAVMVSRKEWENGLADRLASSLSVLLYAILTRRVFLYDWGEGELAAPLWIMWPRGTTRESSCPSFRRRTYYRCGRTIPWSCFTLIIATSRPHSTTLI
jgi:hypothetical protein